MVDRVIEKKTWTPGRIVWIGLAALAISGLAYMLLQRSGGDRLTVDSSRITISRVNNGEFREYFPFDGTIEPETSYFLDVEAGGQVDQIHTQGGHWVEKDELILTISNKGLQRQTIDSETMLLENLDRIRNTQFSRSQSRLLLKDQLLEINYRILNLEKQARRYETMRGTGGVTEVEYENTRDELEYQIGKRDLLEERIRQEELLNEQQLEQADESIARLNASLDLLSDTLNSLEVRAPISGHLSSIDAQVGQSINPGQRIGQIDLLDAFKIRVEVNQFYVSDVQVGTEGHVRIDQQEYPVVVRQIFPEVVGDIFFVDAEFMGPEPASIRRGQSVTVELNFGEPIQALSVRKGGFYQATSGRWAYLIAEDGKTATRTDIRLGRQNPQFVEVLDGLLEGEWIITSGYSTFNDIDTLVFDEPIELGN